MAEKYRICPRLESYKARDGSTQWAPCLFLLDDKQRVWRGGEGVGIFSLDEGHGVAEYFYYKTTKAGDKNAFDMARKYAANIDGAVIVTRWTRSKKERMNNAR